MQSDFTEMDKIDFDCLTERTKTRVSEISLTEFNYAQILCTSNHALISQTGTQLHHPLSCSSNPSASVFSCLSSRRRSSTFTCTIKLPWNVSAGLRRLIGGCVCHRPANLIMHAFYDYPKTKGNENLIAIKLNPNIFSSFDMGCFH